MTIADVQTAIAERRAQPAKVYGVKLNPQDLGDLVRELPTATQPGTYAVLAVDNGVRTLKISGVRAFPRPAVPVGSIVVVSAPEDVET